jgi:hypothetical protein
MGDQAVARPLPTHSQRTNANIRALSGIRTHDPSVQVGEDISWLRPRRHCDWPFQHYFTVNATERVLFSAHFHSTLKQEVNI